MRARLASMLRALAERVDAAEKVERDFLARERYIEEVRSIGRAHMGMGTGISDDSAAAAADAQALVDDLDKSCEGPKYQSYEDWATAYGRPSRERTIFT